jgi:hypothetical protein
VDIPDMIFNETYQNWSPNNFEWSLIDNSQMQMNKDGSLTKPTVGKSTAKQTKRKQDQTQALTNTDGLAIKETGGGYTSIQFADIDQAVDFIHKELGFFPELGDCSLLFGKLYFHAPGCARLAEKKKAKSMGPPQWIDPMTYPPFISLDEETKKRFILCNYPVVKEDGGIVTDTNIMNLDDEKETHEIKNGKNAGFNNYTLANAIKKCITGARDRTIKVAYAINIDNDMPAHAKKDEIDLATKKPRHVDIETTEPSEEPSEEPSAEPSAEESSRGESHEESIELMAKLLIILLQMAAIFPRMKWIASLKKPLPKLAIPKNNFFSSPEGFNMEEYCITALNSLFNWVWRIHPIKIHGYENALQLAHDLWKYDGCFNIEIAQVMT